MRLVIDGNHKGDVQWFEGEITEFNLLTEKESSPYVSRSAPSISLVFSFTKYGFAREDSMPSTTVLELPGTDSVLELYGNEDYDVSRKEDHEGVISVLKTKFQVRRFHLSYEDAAAAIMQRKMTEKNK